MKENISFEVEFQVLDNMVITEKQQIWKRKFVSMEFMRLIRKALDKLKERDDYWNDYKCFERSYGLTILSNDERKHLTLYPLATAPCKPNSLLFHQQTGRFCDWFSWERLIELTEGIQYEMEYFLHKKIPTHLKYSIRRDMTNQKKENPVIRIFQEQEPEEEPQIPFVLHKNTEIDIDECTENS
jgi:hypothetical protein